MGFAGEGLVLPAASGSGKSTLTAALVASGCRYLSDEVAALEPGTWRLVPFAKSLCLKRGGLAALAPLFPRLADSVPHQQLEGRSRWYLPPPANTWPAASMPVRRVVFPRYVPGARTVLRPLARSAALPQLLAQVLGVRTLDATGLEAVIGVLQDADCYTLSVGSLQEAVGVLLRTIS